MTINNKIQLGTMLLSPFGQGYRVRSIAHQLVSDNDLLVLVDRSVPEGIEPEVHQLKTFRRSEIEGVYRVVPS